MTTSGARLPAHEADGVHTPSLDISVRVTTRIDLVWHAIVDPDVRTRWWPGHDFQAVAGATIEAISPRPGRTPARRVRGDITAIDHEGRELHASWTSTPGNYTTTFRLLVSEGKHGTKIRVIETGFPDDVADAQQIVAQSREGWRRLLGDLVDFLGSDENVRAIEHAHRIGR
ncbi:hypothetical protein GCM10011490_02680 [Pseudoclavibacter endophyticus]|nr:hypothetical protein GCM10011490_02680 [Pseudoclavibacter endophyticus]